MAVLDDSDFLSPFSMSEIPVINSDVAELIENSTIDRDMKAQEKNC